MCRIDVSRHASGEPLTVACASGGVRLLYRDIATQAQSMHPQAAADGLGAETIRDVMEDSEGDTQAVRQARERMRLQQMKQQEQQEIQLEENATRAVHHVDIQMQNARPEKSRTKHGGEGAGSASASPGLRGRDGGTAQVDAMSVKEMKEELATLGASAEGCCERSEIEEKLRQVRKGKSGHGFSAAGQDREDKQMEEQFKDKMERGKPSHKGCAPGCLLS